MIKLIIALLIICSLGFNACLKITKKKPKIKFTYEQIDLGDIKIDSSYNLYFNIINAGNSNLNIDTATASCGCTNIKFKTKNIMPGDSTRMIVTFTPPDTGRFYKNIILKSNIDSAFSILYFYGHTINKRKAR